MGDPSVWAVIFLFGGAVFAAQVLGRLRERRERQRMRGRRSEVSEIEPITPPEQLFAAPNAPAQVSSAQKTAVDPVSVLTWPTDNTSLAAAVVAQLGHRHQTLPERDKFFYDLSLLGSSLEAGGVHFDQLFCDAEGVPVTDEMISFLQDHGASGLAEALQRAVQWRVWQEGEYFDPAECEAVLRGETVDLSGRYSPEMCCLAALQSNPHAHFFHMLHVQLAQHFQWEDAPEGKPFVPIQPFSEIAPLGRPRHPEGLGARRLLSWGYQEGYFLRADELDLDAKTRRLMLQAARLDEAFDEFDPHFRSYYDDPLQSNLVEWLREQKFPEVADEIAARARREALLARGADDLGEALPEVNWEFDFEPYLAEIRSKADASLQYEFRWAGAAEKA